MSEEKILSSERKEFTDSGVVIAGEVKSTSTDDSNVTIINTLKDRISISTQNGGLKQLPENFDDPQGDWVVINSANPFEILYLDYKQYKFIEPHQVNKNYEILEKLWRDKTGLMNTGGNRVAFKSKYGDGTVENSLSKLQRAYEKLKTRQGIEEYYKEINSARIQKGEEQLKPFLRMMMSDGIADKGEIENIFQEGIKFDLEKEEIALIIKLSLVEKGYKSYGTISGKMLSEKLLSVEHWMTEEEHQKAKQHEKEREALKIQILPGKYAKNNEDIGTILFSSSEEAKELIKEDLLKQAIAQKDIVLAREVGNISKNTKDIQAAYLKTVYKLNKTLPYRFIKDKYAPSVEVLCAMIFESALALKTGKEDIQKVYIEIWLEETNTDAYKKFISIRDSANNVNLALLEFLYTFNKKLPYKFNEYLLAQNPSELCDLIDSSKENWEAGKVELYNSSILVWLKTTGKSDIVEKWNSLLLSEVKENKDLGLEEFLHLLKPTIEYAELITDKSSLSFPAIQSGKSVTADILLSNTKRGFLSGAFSFSKNLKGVTLSKTEFTLNTAAALTNLKLTLTIDTLDLLKGVNYESTLHLTTSTNQKIKIPVSFKVVFPKNAFIFEILKYAAVISTFFVLLRLCITSTNSAWLNQQFNFYLGWQDAIYNYGSYAVFGWTFSLFITGLGFGIYFLTKYLKKGNRRDKITYSV